MLRRARRRFFPHAADPRAHEGKRQYLDDTRGQPDSGVRWLVWGLGVLQAALVVRPLAGWPRTEDFVNVLKLALTDS